MKTIIIPAAALTLAATILAAPASAAPVSVTGPKPTANARVVKPLQLTAEGNLDFGTILLVNVTSSQTVSVGPSGRSCGTGLTCSGTFSMARYRVVGTQGQMIQITSATPTYTLTGSNGGSLTLTPILPAPLMLDNSGNPGKLFDVGGTLQINPTTPDGVYSGAIDIQVNYQ